jgi:cytochrome c2
MVIMLSLAFLSGNTAVASKLQNDKPRDNKSRSASKKTNAVAPGITQLSGSENDVPKPSKEVLELLENMNQCAGTVQHYRLPPTGYTPPSESDASRQGKQLYTRLECASCHKIKGQGGTLGPPLDGIGGARGEQFITAHLLDPEKQMQEFPDLFGGRPNIMPHPGVSLKDAKLITSYLLALPEPENGFLISAHPKIDVSQKKIHKQASANSDSIKDGRTLFLSHGCAACHTLNSAASRFGPRLDGISARRTRLTVEEAMRGGTDEPEMNFRALHLTNEESKHIVDFLMNLPKSK